MGHHPKKHKYKENLITVKHTHTIKAVRLIDYVAFDQTVKHGQNDRPSPNYALYLMNTEK